MRLSFSPRARALLRRLPVDNVYSLFELIFLALLAIQCARLIWAVVTPVSPLGDWRVAQPGVPGSPAAILRGFDPFFRTSNTGNPGQPVVTTLQLKLFGTRTNDASGLGSAIIAGPDGLQKSVGVGEEIVPGATLKAVTFDHVTIDRGGVSEELYIDQSGGGTNEAAPADAAALPPGAPLTPPPPGSAGVTAAQLKSDIAFIPRIDGGRVTGLVVRPQGAAAAFKAIGLREGDVVTAAGGRPITGPADIDRLISGLTPGTNLSITVERGADVLPLAVTIRGQ
jgi:general secretion pathway protein C